MFIKVHLLQGYTKPLWYVVPISWLKKRLQGALVRVPLRKRSVVGIIQEVTNQPPHLSCTLREAQSLEPFPCDEHYFSFIQKTAHYYHIQPTVLLQRIKSFITKKEVEAFYMPGMVSVSEHKKIQLTEEQKQIVTDVQQYIENQRFQPFLLHGVTGSGKTAVYQWISEQVLMQKKTVIYLLPEVSLAARFTDLFKLRLPGTPIVGFHSASSTADKKWLWQLLLAGEPALIIGVHLPILLPIFKLGGIIIDEEHDCGYQEKKHPKLNTKEVALLRAQLYDVPIMLGSATPALTSLYNVEHRGWIKHTLTTRYAGNFPKINVVSLKNFKQRREFWFSDALLNALTDRLQKKEQSIIFLNRRGHSFFVQCKYCSFVFTCNYCAVSLTLHEDNRLLCHYCGHSVFLKETCPTCKNTQSFLKKGIGTQQVVNILKKLFPYAQIERADLDATVNRKKWQNIVERMHAGALDILVGTQTITKGYDFKRLTLVGVLWADLSLHFPTYNASENALQQLLQVAGRAGRHSAESLVIVQTMTDHPIFSYLSEKQYMQFYVSELTYRAQGAYPPFMRLAEIELRHKKQETICDESQKIAAIILNMIKEKGLQATILGPADPPVNKIQEIYRKKICIKSPSIQVIHLIFQTIFHYSYQSEIFLQQNPLN